MPWGFAAAAVAGAVASAALAPSPPATPDYAAAAQQQGASNIQAAQASTQLGRPNQVTPWGSSMWYQGAPSQNNASGGASSGNQRPMGNAGQAANGFQGVTNGADAGNGVAAPGVQANYSGGYGGFSGYGGSGYGGSGYGGSGGGASGAGGNLPYTPYSPYNSNSTGYSPSNQWTNVVSLAPAQQKLFDTQNQISQSLADQGSSQLGQVRASESQPFNLGGMPGMQYGGQTPNLQTSFNNSPVQRSIDTSGVNAIPGTDSGGLSGLADKAATAAGARNTQMLDQQEESTKAQMAAQGITPGSDAYNRAMQPIQQARVDSGNQAFLTGQGYENQLYNQGLQTNQTQFGQAQAQGQFGNTAAGQQYSQDQGLATFGNTAAQNQFGMGLQGSQFSNQARGQSISEQQMLRELPLNELNALRSGSQVQAPQFAQYSSPGVQPTPYLQAAGMQGAANQQAYQNQVGQFNNTMSGLYGLGGSAAQGYASGMFSDRRMKRDVVRIGTTAKGLPWYRFEYAWGIPSEGVMADEVEQVLPHAVTRRGGFAMVDYAQVI